MCNIIGHPVMEAAKANCPGPVNLNDFGAKLSANNAIFVNEHVSLLKL
jgi:hypothetical protein